MSRGHDVLSCDLEPGYFINHYQGNVFELNNLDQFDLLIAFPPCTYLCKAQLWMCARSEDRLKKQKQAIQFVKNLFNLPIKKIAIENPPGILTKQFKKPDQLIHPYFFGDNYKKSTHLWLKNLKPLNYDRGNVRRLKIPEVKVVSNHVNSRMSQDQKTKIKSNWKYFPKTAMAMATQWG